MTLREILKDGVAEHRQAHRDQHVGLQGRVSFDEVDRRLELEQLSRVQHEHRVHLLRVQRDLAPIMFAVGHLHGTGKSSLSAGRESLMPKITKHCSLERLFRLKIEIPSRELL